MLQLITADGCAWIAATAIIGVRRGQAGRAVIKLQDGQAVSSLEQYEAFIERLNSAWLKTAGVEVTQELESSGAGTMPIPVRSSQEEIGSELNLGVARAGDDTALVLDPVSIALQPITA